jgi:hypothetical protein
MSGFGIAVETTFQGIFTVNFQTHYWVAAWFVTRSAAGSHSNYGKDILVYVSTRVTKQHVSKNESLGFGHLPRTGSLCRRTRTSKLKRSVDEW